MKFEKDMICRHLGEIPQLFGMDTEWKNACILDVEKDTVKIAAENNFSGFQIFQCKKQWLKNKKFVYLQSKE